MAQASIEGGLKEASTPVTGPDVLALNQTMLDLPEVIGMFVTGVSPEKAFEEPAGE